MNDRLSLLALLLGLLWFVDRLPALGTLDRAFGASVLAVASVAVALYAWPTARPLLSDVRVRLQRRPAPAPDA